MSDQSSKWSQSIDQCLGEFNCDPNQCLVCDILIIGSGYGGSFAARELAAPDTSVWVMERGREYALGDFPEDIGMLPGHVRMHTAPDADPIGNTNALLDFRRYQQVSVLLANGLGGGSLINAGVAVRPPASLLEHPAWPDHYRNSAAERSTLWSAMAEVEAQLQAGPLDGVQALKKFKALDKLGRSMGREAEPAPLTIASVDQISPAGVSQKACTRCGNCFTGCNVGAKNTLVTHVVPDAVRRGARFYTGATALEVLPWDGPEQTTPNGRKVRWRVAMVCTQGQGQASTRREFEVLAHTVILAAGTLGSSEILLKSPQVASSALLGTRFSTNGDVLALGWGMKDQTNGMAQPGTDTATLQAPDDRVGPTITGIVRAEIALADADRRTVLIEEGAVPSALTQAVLALGASLSLPHRYTGPEGPAYYGQGYGVDRLATPPDMARHAMLLLGMGPDDADGTMTLKARATGAPALDITWPEKGAGPDSPYYRGVHKWLGSAAAQPAGGGFGGGDYLPNPLWQALPADFQEIAGGDKPTQGMTVHPLGGCGMGDDVRSGVVDWRGTVFKRGDAGGVHEGLHVLDGAMLPTAVGVNPFLTISALSLVAARSIRASLAMVDRPALPPLALAHAQAQSEAPRSASAGPITLRFREHLQGHWQGPDPAWLAAAPSGQTLNAAERERAWVLAVDVSLNLEQWLANPSMQLKGASLRVFRNPMPQDISVHPDACSGTAAFEGTGYVSLLALNAPKNGWDQFKRMVLAGRAFLQRRGFKELTSLIGSAPPKPGQNALVGMWRRVLGFLRAARNLTRYRELIYSFELHATDRPDFTVKAEGRKRLSYAPGQKNVWDALVDIDLTFTPHGGQKPATLQVTADLIDMVRNHRLQVAQAPNTPAAIVGLAAFGAMWLRAIFQTHFWSFRGLDYDRLKPPQAAEHGLVSGAAAPVRVPLVVRRYSDPARGDEMLTLQLTCYAPAMAPASPRHLLMVHGLAHGGTVFTTHTTDGKNMAAAFVAAGHTVWVLDHRLSNRLPYHDHDHCIDDVARLDITAAVHHVYAAAGQPIAVFAHCVGGAAFAMATLSGWLHDQANATSMVGSATIHAVHPWVVPSASNQLSGALAALYKDFLPQDMAVDPVPPAGESTALDQVIDRMAASLPWPEAELPLHLKDQFDPQGGTATCNRMTLFYGREWVHANLAEATHRELASLVGPASIEVFRQLFFIINRQRLTDRNGASAYMTTEQFQTHWTFPTLFAHGSENRVFDPRSAVRSWARLRDLQPGRVVRVFMAEGYGHMDFLFGKNAHRDVYPKLNAFFDAPTAFQSSWGADLDALQVPAHLRDHTANTPRSALAGPHIRLDECTVDGQTRRQLVLWTEFPNDPTRSAGAPTLHGAGGHALPDWKASRLEHIHLYTQGDSEVTLLKGRGAYWTGRLTESPNHAFANLSDVNLSWGANGALGQAGLAFSAFHWWHRWLGKPVSAPVSWLALSCRWPGTPFEGEGVDAVALHMLAHVSDAKLPVDALVMLGDQIYADATANVLTTHETDEQLADLYRDAWGSPHTQALLQSLPSYTVVDDHEYGDNWSGSSAPAKDRDFVDGFEAALAYQWRWRDDPVPAAPCRPDLDGDHVTGFWSTFKMGHVAAFAADTRSERALRTPDNWQTMSMFGAPQMDALKAWLLANRDQPKVLCSGSVFGFVEQGQQNSAASCVNADGWAGYPATWQALVQFIVQEQIQNLVFLSGDYHFSGMAELLLSAQGPHAPVRALSVVCSGWNASLPFANAAPHDFVMDQQVDYPCSNASVTVACRAVPLSTALRQFSKITVSADAQSAWWLTARVYDAMGQLDAQQTLKL